MVSTKAEVLDLLQKHEGELSKLGVRSYGIFGSFLHDQVSPESDVDILVEFLSEKKTFTNFSNLHFYLEELLGRPVELVTEESLSPLIGPYILNEVEHVQVSS